MEEGVGFEPTDRLLAISCFRDKCNKPDSASLPWIRESDLMPIDVNLEGTAFDLPPGSTMCHRLLPRRFTICYHEIGRHRRARIVFSCSSDKRFTIKALCRLSWSCRWDSNSRGCFHSRLQGESYRPLRDCSIWRWSRYPESNRVNWSTKPVHHHLCFTGMSRIGHLISGYLSCSVFRAALHSEIGRWPGNRTLIFGFGDRGTSRCTNHLCIEKLTSNKKYVGIEPHVSSSPPESWPLDEYLHKSRICCSIIFSCGCLFVGTTCKQFQNW